MAAVIIRQHSIGQEYFYQSQGLTKAWPGGKLCWTITTRRSLLLKSTPKARAPSSVVIGVNEFAKPVIELAPALKLSFDMSCRI